MGRIQSQLSAAARPPLFLLVAFRLLRDSLTHVASAAPHAQHRHQGGPQRRGDHQTALRSTSTSSRSTQGAERLRHRGRSRRRGRDHRDPARPTPATASSPRNRQARGAQTATTSGSSIRSTARPTSSTACRPTRSRSGWRFATRSSRPSSTTRRATTCSMHRRGRGAFLNDKRLRVSKRTRLADALVGTGFPFRKGGRLRALPEDVRDR